MWNIQKFVSKLKEAAEESSYSDDAPSQQAAAAPSKGLASQDPDEEQIGELFQEYSSLIEYERVQDLVPMGMYLVPSFEAGMEWHGCAFVPKGPYKGGIFKFMIFLGETYPETPPDIIFASDIFHPMVHARSRRFQVEALFPEWETGSDYVTCVLPHLHRALRQQKYFWTGRGKPLNPLALHLLKSDFKAYAEKAAECARMSSDRVYENPPGFALPFTRNPKSAHLAILQELANLQGRLETRSQDLADRICDQYAAAKKQARISVTSPTVETIDIPARTNELESHLPGFAPPGGWRSYPPGHDDDEEEEEAEPRGENEVDEFSI